MTLDQDALLAQAGQWARDALNEVAVDPYLPKELSPMGRSAVTALVGAVEGIGRETVGKWGLFDKAEFQAIATFGSQIVYALKSDASAADQVNFVGHALLSVGTSLAVEVSKDALNVVPIAGAVIGAVIDMMTAIIGAVQEKSDYEKAVEAERDRAERCKAILEAAKVLEPTSGQTPSDVFNGQQTLALPMPALGTGLVCASEINGFVAPKTRKMFANLRRFIQGSWYGEGDRGREFDGSKVPVIPSANSDGGQSLWPVYLDALLWQRALGRVPDDAIYTGLAAVTECAPEIVPQVVATLDDWATRSLSAKTGTGYVQYRQFTQTPLTATQELAMRISSAAWAGKKAGRNYQVQGAGNKLALVEPSGASVSFPRTMTGTSSAPISSKARGGSGGAVVFLLAGATALALAHRR